jgi:hypothetical protein
MQLILHVPDPSSLVRSDAFTPCLHGTLPPLCLVQWHRPSHMFDSPLYTTLSALLTSTKLPYKRVVLFPLDELKLVNERESQMGSEGVGKEEEEEEEERTMPFAQWSSALSATNNGSSPSRVSFSTNRSLHYTQHMCTSTRVMCTLITSRKGQGECMCA